MSENPLQERLINNFAPLGYKLFADDDFGITNEFRKDESDLRFCVRYGEGGVTLYWTSSPEYDLLNANTMKIWKESPQDIQLRTFSGSPEEFWQAVSDIIDGREPA